MVITINMQSYPKEFNAKIYENYGYKAHNKGFFDEWRALSSSLREEKDIPLCDASILAYNKLKLQGSA